MDWSKKLVIAGFLIIALAIHGVCGDAMVTGTVFCDQCKDGLITLFDYPLNGIGVKMVCPSGDGQETMLGTETTNWMGNYVMRFDGTPDLTGCYAQVTGNGQDSGCGAVSGPGKYVRLMFNMFDMEMYTVDPLISQPAQPASFCPRSLSPVTPGNAPVVRLPPANPPPEFKLPPVNPPPEFRLPPVPTLPKLPPIPRLPPTPPMPYLEASACPYQKWMMQEYKCYWKVVTPDTKVAVVFGLLAARKYGTDLTLWQGMQGRGDPYKTLLREGTTALLNSYNSIQFPYHPLGVIQHMNWALMGSTRHVLHTALGFLRANSGTGTTTCRFSSCK